MIRATNIIIGSTKPLVAILTPATQGKYFAALFLFLALVINTLLGSLLPEFQGLTGLVDSYSGFLCHLQPVLSLGASIQSSSVLVLIRQNAVSLLFPPPGSKSGSSVSVPSAISLLTLQVDRCLFILHSTVKLSLSHG